MIVGAIDDGTYPAQGNTSFVVFGTATGFPAALELNSLDGENGFAIEGGGGEIEPFASNRHSVSRAGDVNGDGIDDIIIGSPYANLPGRLSAGRTLVVFGSSEGFAETLNLDDLEGTNGFTINGIERVDVDETIFSGRSGWSVGTAGDVNADGIDDVLIGESPMTLIRITFTREAPL